MPKSMECKDRSTTSARYYPRPRKGYQKLAYRKLAYAINMTGKKLLHYFECHSIIVVASTPVSSILNNPDVTGRVSLWGITLGPWEIMYQRQSAIKSQVLPDFIAEWTKAQMPELPDLSN
jgi:hypothetical protein